MRPETARAADDTRRAKAVEQQRQPRAGHRNHPAPRPFRACCARNAGDNLGLRAPCQKKSPRWQFHSGMRNSLRAHIIILCRTHSFTCGLLRLSDSGHPPDARAVLHNRPDLPKTTPRTCTRGWGTARGAAARRAQSDVDQSAAQPPGPAAAPKSGGETAPYDPAPRDWQRNGPVRTSYSTFARQPRGNDAHRAPQPRGPYQQQGSDLRECETQPARCCPAARALAKRPRKSRITGPRRAAALPKGPRSAGRASAGMCGHVRAPPGVRGAGVRGAGAPGRACATTPPRLVRPTRSGSGPGRHRATRSARRYPRGTRRGTPPSR